MSSSFLLGIDLGTSTIKGILIEKEGGRVSQNVSRPLGKHETATEVPSARERRVEDILSCLETVMAALDASKLQRVCGIGICGQMHGCTMWKDSLKLDGAGSATHCLSQQTCSNLVTWQDGRCSPEFLSSFPATRQLVPVSSGYGCATLAWFHHHQPTFLQRFSKAGTIMDLLVWLLCSAKREEGEEEEEEAQPVLMSAQNAMSWGYFDVKTMEWERNLLDAAWFPVELLPRVVASPAVAGHLHTSWHGIPGGTAVGVAMGDLQCSFKATVPSTSDAVLNIGSASQLAVIKPAASSSSSSSSSSVAAAGDGNDLVLPPSLMEVPYFGGDSLLVAASLTGANALSLLVETLRKWMEELGVKSEAIPSDEELYGKVFSLAEEKLESTLSVQVTLWGERHDTGLRGAASNVEPESLSLGDVASATLRGVLENLRAMMPNHILKTLQIKRLLGSGSVLQRSHTLRHHAKTVLGLPMELREQADAPLGAALAAKELVTSTLEQTQNQ